MTKTARIKEQEQRIQYPHGAVRTLDELKSIVARAKAGEKVGLYPWRAWKKGIIGTHIIDDATKIHDTSIIIGEVLRLNMTYSLPATDQMLIEFSNRGIEGFGSTRSRRYSAYFFTNYWFAYAHMLREAAADDIKAE